MERKRSVRTRRPKAPFQRAMDHCRAFTAFMFSNVGITFLVVLYIIAGEWKSTFSVVAGKRLHLKLKFYSFEEICERELLVVISFPFFISFRRLNIISMDRKRRSERENWKCWESTTRCCRKTLEYHLLS